MGVGERQLMELPRYRQSDAFNDAERAAIDLAAAMAQTPAEISEELRARLRRFFTEPQLVELAAAIAWENFRSRFNRAFGIRSSGFSEGAFCAVPEHASA